MRKLSEPIVGQWYLRRDSEEMFRVVAVDAASSSVEIQTFDGDVEELDLDDWQQLRVREIDAPEDWSGPFDDLEPGDLGDTELPLTGADWRSPNDPAARWEDVAQNDDLDEEREQRLIELTLEEDEIET